MYRMDKVARNLTFRFIMFTFCVLFCSKTMFASTPHSNPPIGANDTPVLVFTGSQTQVEFLVGATNLIE